jgi:GTPase SAR1 family protein
VPTVALVGYTNAGKTTLFNRLTHEQAVASDALFVTLQRDGSAAAAAGPFRCLLPAPSPFLAPSGTNSGIVQSSLVMVEIIPILM